MGRVVITRIKSGYRQPHGKLYFVMYLQFLCFLALSSYEKLISITDISLLSLQTPSLPKGEKSDGVIHVGMIFDENRANYALSTIRSISYYSSSSIVYHLVTPMAIHHKLNRLAGTLSGQNNINCYDILRCHEAISPVGFLGKKIHISAMCKTFLPDILPNWIPSLIYVDSDVTVVSDINLCYKKIHHFDATQYLGMSVDMGEVCQYFPDKCFPMAFEVQIAEGLECGTVPERASKVRDSHNPCRNPGDHETYQFNGGMVLMDLNKMRQQRFTTMFSIASTLMWTRLGYKQPGWGEQCLLNNFFRFKPEILYETSCGCNYQFSAARRESKCANETVVIAHGWSGGMHNSKNPFIQHFLYFMNPGISPPKTPSKSDVSKQWKVVPLVVTRDRFCKHQSMNCTIDDFKAFDELEKKALEKSTEQQKPIVNILTRTSGRPRFFQEMVNSVREQVYPNIYHIVLTDDETSLRYIKDVDKLIYTKSLRDEFNRTEACDNCGHLSNGKSCLAAPSLDKPKERRLFLSCYCDSSYPMNSYINEMVSVAKMGYIVILDDDNLLVDKYAISELVSHIVHENMLYAFRSLLGRVTPHDSHFGKEIAMGDFDTSNFMYHTKLAKKARWPPTRCGDYKVATEIASTTSIKWINRLFIHSNPMRASLGGLGKREDMYADKLIVIVTSYMTHGWRPNWVKQIVNHFLSEEMSVFVSKVILVWNNVEEDVPNVIPKSSDRFVIVRCKQNSLNNRWVMTLPYLTNSTYVLNFDDDVYLSRQGLICMLGWQKKYPNRIVAPFVRRIGSDGKYIVDEILDGSSYSIGLPRIAFVPIRFLKEYASVKYSSLRQYVDEQVAHCDDILLNAVSQKGTKNPPIRVLLPEESVYDFYSNCWSQSKEQTGGLALQVDRAKSRTDCVKYILQQTELHAFTSTTQVGTCFPKGNPSTIVNSVSPENLEDTKNKSLKCGW